LSYYIRSTIFVFVLLTCIAGLTVHAAEQSQPAGPMPTSGFRTDFLQLLDDVEEKLVSLAEAVPAEKYGWRPAEGVRSISEVYMHVAGGNYLLPSFIGVDAPAGISRDMEKTVTDKPKVIDAMKQSFDHLRQATLKISDADLDKKTNLFGREASYREVFLIISNHCHEHLGQSIAYARMNGVVPPWSANQ
jgi:uncharacterized damage-inducible protein DinB